MFNIGLNILSPFKVDFKPIKSIFGRVYKNKYWELELFRFNTIISFRLEIRIGCDHPGLYIELGLLTYNVAFNFYDNRHYSDSN